MTVRTGADTQATAPDALACRERAIRLRLEELLGPAPEWSAGLVEALITSFLSRSADYLETLGEAIAARDVDAISRDSHSLKGMAGNLGAVELAAISEALETCARCGQVSPAPQLLERLTAELDAVRPAMLRVLAA